MSRTLMSCPLCVTEKIRRTEVIVKRGKSYPMAQCGRCLTVFNVGAYSEILNRSHRETQSTVVYSDKAVSVDFLRREVSQRSLLINSLVKRVGRELAGSNFLDFGTGRGCAAIAASQECSTVYGVDYDLEAPRSVSERLGAKRVIWGESLESVACRVDFCLIWHTLEHIPYPLSELTAIKQLLRPNGCIFIQVPLFRPEYVEMAHFAFYNEASALYLADVLQMKVNDLVIDQERSFLTFILMQAP